MKKDRKLIWTSIFTAIGASLCCITPLLALISGATGIASTFSWIEPLRPYLIGATILVLAFAWYQKLKSQKEIDCACDSEAGQKMPFMQSKSFLGLVTAFSILMLAFPYYENAFYPKTEKKIVVADPVNIQEISIDIEGMTCTSCERHINHSVHQLEGILDIEASYEKGNALIAFDKTKTTPGEIEEAILSTGYKIVHTKQK